MARYLKIAFSPILFVAGIPGLFDDLKVWSGWLNLNERQGVNYVLVILASLLLLDGTKQWWLKGIKKFTCKEKTEHEQDSNLQEDDPDLETIRSFLNEAQKRIDVVLEDPKTQRKVIAFSFDLDTKIYPFLKEAFKPPRDQDLKKLIKRGWEEHDTLSPEFNEPTATKSFLEKLKNKIKKEDLNSEFTPPPSFKEFSGDDVGSL